MKVNVKKFQFIIPNTRWFGKRFWGWDVPGVTILAPMLKSYGYDVNILEANIDNLGPDEIKERIRAFNPDVVGISNMSIEYWAQLHEVAKITKEVSKEIVTVAGGVHVTTLPDRAMQDENLDFVIMSEGEERLFQLLDILKKGDYDFTGMNGILWRDKDTSKINKIKNIGWYGAKKHHATLDDIYPPDFSIYEDPKKFFSNKVISAGGMSSRRSPVGSMLTSRGCPYKCSFCASPVTTGQKMRFRSPENVIREVDVLVNTYGVKEIIFQDDEMYAHRQRAVEIVKLLKERNYDLVWKNLNIASWRLDFELLKLMKESGCYQITISAESGNERVLKDIIHKPANLQNAIDVVKWCKELDIETQVDFVFGFPGETWDEIRDTTNYADKLDADSVKFAVATPFPATELLKKAEEAGMFPKNYDFYTNDYLGFANPTMSSEHWTANDLKLLRVMEWDRINFKNEEKKKRYARVNELTLEQLEDFRIQTRKNLGVYFVDQAKEDREKSTLNEKKNSEDRRWKLIRETAKKQAEISNNQSHEVI